MTSLIGTPLCSFHSNSNGDRGLPGIDVDRKGFVMPYSAAAPKEYADNEGWQIVKRRGAKKYRTQNKKRKTETEAAIAAADA